MQLFKCWAFPVSNSSCTNTNYPHSMGQEQGQEQEEGLQSSTGRGHGRGTPPPPLPTIASITGMLCHWRGESSLRERRTKINLCLEFEVRETNGKLKSGIRDDMYIDRPGYTPAEDDKSTSIPSYTVSTSPWRHNVQAVLPVQIRHEPCVGASANVWHVRYSSPWRLLAVPDSSCQTRPIATR